LRTTDVTQQDKAPTSRG